MIKEMWVNTDGILQSQVF